MDASGNGVESLRTLRVPAENLVQLRARDQDLYELLLKGVPGTGMPGFGFFTRDELGRLIALLRVKGLGSEPAHLPASTTANLQPQDIAQAEKTFAALCSRCHGEDGRGSTLGNSLQPPPPDLRQLSVTPQRAFQIITDGYPGTMMPAFRAYSEKLRWALAGKVLEFYRGDRSASAEARLVTFR